MKKVVNNTFLFLFLFVSVFLFAGSVFALSINTYDSATVDGDYTDWDLNNDFFADMYIAGNDTKSVLSKLYLRYDPNSTILYALVLDVDTTVGNPVSQDNSVPELSSNDAWIKIYDNGWSNDLLIDGNSPPGGNTTPRGFEWVYGSTSTLLGYEAYAQLDTGTYEEFEAHLNFLTTLDNGSIDNDTSSTGKWAGLKAGISLEIDPPPTQDPPQVPEPCTMLLVGAGLIGMAAVARRKEMKKY